MIKISKVYIHTQNSKPVIWIFNRFGYFTRPARWPRLLLYCPIRPGGDKIKQQGAAAAQAQVSLLPDVSGPNKGLRALPSSCSSLRSTVPGYFTNPFLKHSINLAAYIITVINTRKLTSINTHITLPLRETEPEYSQN